MSHYYPAEVVEQTLTQLVKLAQEAYDCAESIAHEKRVTSQELNRLQVYLKEAKQTADVELHKVASASDFVIEDTMDKLAASHLINPEDKDVLLKKIKDNPSEIFGLVNKLASVFRLPAPEGAGYKQASSTAPEADQDGWDAFIHSV